MQIDTGSDEERSIDLAPLLDCIFLLLIFFMITTSFNQDESPQLEIPLELPRVTSGLDTTVEESPMPLKITVDRFGKYYLNDASCEFADLHRILKTDTQVQPNRKIVIIGDRDASFDRVARVMDLCHLLGCRNVSVRAEQEQ